MQENTTENIQLLWQVYVFILFAVIFNSHATKSVPTLKFLLTACLLV